MVNDQQLSNLGPDGGLLQYWTRQGISLTALMALIEQAETAAVAAEAALAALQTGGITGVSSLGASLMSAVDRAAAWSVLGITGAGSRIVPDPDHPGLYLITA